RRPQRRRPVRIRRRSRQRRAHQPRPDDAGIPPARSLPPDGVRMSRRDRAIALRDEIRDACTAAGLSRVLVTIDPLEAANGYTYGVVVIVPPKIDFTSWNETVETWTVHVAAGPWDDLV